MRAETAAFRPRALFVTDIDGTLLGPEGELPQANVEALRAADEAGVALALVTGRRRSTVAREHARLAGLRYRVAASCGSILLGSDHVTVERVLPLPWSVVDALARREDARHGRLVCITVADGDDERAEDTFVLAPHSRDWHVSRAPLREEPRERVDEARARSRTLVHVALLLPSREEADALAPELRREVPPGVSVHTVQNPAGPGALVELVAAGGKGNAVRHLAESLGIPAAATGAIGDDMNDADLLDAATHRYAVGGSVLAARRPDAITVSRAAEGAVADALGRFLATLAVPA